MEIFFIKGFHIIICIIISYYALKESVVMGNWNLLPKMLIYTLSKTYKVPLK